MVSFEPWMQDMCWAMSGRTSVIQRTLAMDREDVCQELVAYVLRALPICKDSGQHVQGFVKSVIKQRLSFLSTTAKTIKRREPPRVGLVTVESALVAPEAPDALQAADEAMAVRRAVRKMGSKRRAVCEAYLKAGSIAGAARLLCTSHQRVSQLLYSEKTAVAFASAGLCAN